MLQRARGGARLAGQPVSGHGRLGGERRVGAPRRFAQQRDRLRWHGAELSELAGGRRGRAAGAHAVGQLRQRRGPGGRAQPGQGLHQGDGGVPLGAGGELAAEQRCQTVDRLGKGGGGGAKGTAVGAPGYQPGQLPAHLGADGGGTAARTRPVHLRGLALSEGGETSSGTSSAGRKARVSSCQETSSNSVGGLMVRPLNAGRAERNGHH
ncbi:hypothetical protein EBN88_25960 [Streptomyces triticirhizae]|uniref:Uncharacterized protein n=1 Tax=Streptomyces triticirhizae TaxID=2483353 RepID=A0A3M2L0E9_9ACTN|nr:hypothetical protein EBN88_25960 [Streptomyces triticirhizae]